MLLPDFISYVLFLPDFISSTVAQFPGIMFENDSGISSELNERIRNVDFRGKRIFRVASRREAEVSVVGRDPVTAEDLGQAPVQRRREHSIDPDRDVLKFRNNCILLI